MPWSQKFGNLGVWYFLSLFFFQASHSQYFSLVQDIAQKAHEVAGGDNNRHRPCPCHPFTRAAIDRVLEFLSSPLFPYQTHYRRSRNRAGHHHLQRPNRQLRCPGYGKGRRGVLGHREEGTDHGRWNRNSRRHAVRLWLRPLLFRHQRQTPMGRIQEPLHPAFREEDFPASKPSLRLVTYSSSLRTLIERLLQPLFQLQEPRTEFYGLQILR